MNRESLAQYTYETISAARRNIGAHLKIYNLQRPHTALNGEAPDAFYYRHQPPFLVQGAESMHCEFTSPVVILSGQEKQPLHHKKYLFAGFFS
ncbi:MAG: integrase core domain-containing protein [Paralcaligenes sp.]